jgi:class 3 adenylate cyclase
VPERRPRAVPDVEAFLDTARRRPTDSGAAPPRPFFGRGDELASLAQGLDLARRGSPQAVLLSGDVGLGKSRLLRGLQRLASDQGFEVLPARCMEHVDLPYLPFQASFLPCLADLAREDGSLRRYADVIEGAFTSATPGPVPAGEGGPAHEQAWLFLAVARTTIALAQRRPAILTVDDLQWADRPSADVLCYLVQEVADASIREHIPLVIAAAHRPDVDDRLARDLARLRREEICHTLDLEPLDEHAAGECIRALGLRRASRQLVDAVRDTAGGNPLLIESIVAQLLRCEGVREEGGEDVLAVPLADLGIPAGVGDAIATRIDELGGPCRELLTVAAVTGDPFTTATLAEVAHRPEAALDVAVTEALERGVIARDREGFAFTHPLFAQMLRCTTAPGRRRELHLAVARALASASDQRDRRDLEIAFHLGEAGTAADPVEVVSQCRAAGDRAWHLAAWGEAARFFDTAAEALARAPRQTGDVEMAELLCQAGIAHSRNMDPGPSRARVNRALAGFRAAGDPRGVGRALLELVRTGVGWGSFDRLVDVEQLEELVPDLEELDPQLCARVLVQLAEAGWVRGRLGSAEDCALRALGLAGRVGDRETQARAEIARAQLRWIRLELRGAVDHLRAALRWTGPDSDPWLSGFPLPRLALTLFWVGQLDEAAAVAIEARDHAERTHAWTEQSLALAALTCIAVARGEFDEAERHGEAAWAALRLSRYTWTASLLFPALVSARLLQGDVLGARSAVDRWRATVADHEDPRLVDTIGLVDLLVDASDGDQAAVGGWVAAQPGWLEAGWPVMLGGVQRLAVLVDASGAAGIEVRLPALARGLDEAADRGMLLTDGLVALVPRLRAVVAARERRFADAEREFRRAIDIAAAMGARPELARAQLEYAQLLHDHGWDPDRARGLVATAVAHFGALGMPLYARAAATLADELGVQRPTAVAVRADRGTLAVEHTMVLLFTDVVDSTAMTERLGDVAYLERAEALDATTRADVQRCTGRPVEGIRPGDGLLALFNSAHGAIECAALAHEHAAAVGLQLHVGIHAGDVIRSGTGIHGGAVNLAARVCEAAPPGTTLVSATVRSLATTSIEAEFEDFGLRELKGIAERQHLFGVSACASAPN